MTRDTLETVTFYVSLCLFCFGIGWLACELTHSGMEAQQDVAVEQEGPSTRTVSPAGAAERPSPLLTNQEGENNER